MLKSALLYFFFFFLNKKQTINNKVTKHPESVWFHIWKYLQEVRDSGAGRDAVFLSNKQIIANAALSQTQGWDVQLEWDI